MKKHIGLTIVLFLAVKINIESKSITSEVIENNAQEYYETSDFAQVGLCFDAFKLAFDGWLSLKGDLNFKSSLISIVDFGLPSNVKRYFLINIESKTIVHQDYVSHGKNTGNLWADKFSNIVNSNQSSLGFYKTAETYYGRHGLSLRLDGLEKGINDNARKRAIVMHSANYAEASFIKMYGRLGRSFGCPTLPSKGFNKIIKLIKNGTLLFVYHPQKEYQLQSSILNQSY